MVLSWHRSMIIIFFMSGSLQAVVQHQICCISCAFISPTATIHCGWPKPRKWPPDLTKCYLACIEVNAGPAFESDELTVCMRPLVVPCHDHFCFLKMFKLQGQLHNYHTNNRHVCTHLNAYLMVILNVVIQFNNFDIIKHLKKLGPAYDVTWKSLRADSLWRLKVYRMIYLDLPCVETWLWTDTFSGWSCNNASFIEYQLDEMRQKPYVIYRQDKPGLGPWNYV